MYFNHLLLLLCDATEYDHYSSGQHCSSDGAILCDEIDGQQEKYIHFVIMLIVSI